MQKLEQSGCVSARYLQVLSGPPAWRAERVAQLVATAGDSSQDPWVLPKAVACPVQESWCREDGDPLTLLKRGRYEAICTALDDPRREAGRGMRRIATTGQKQSHFGL